MTKQQTTSTKATKPATLNECGCGCGTLVKRTFAQGHDMKLRSALGKAYKAGEPGAEEALRQHGFPIPAPKAPKAKPDAIASAVTANFKTAKATNAKAKAAVAPKARARKRTPARKTN